MSALSSVTKEATLICGFSKSKDLVPILEKIVSEHTVPKLRAVHPVSCQHFRLQDSSVLYQ